MSSVLLTDKVRLKLKTIGRNKKSLRISERKTLAGSISNYKYICSELTVSKLIKQKLLNLNNKINTNAITVPHFYKYTHDTKKLTKKYQN